MFGFIQKWIDDVESRIKALEDKVEGLIKSMDVRATPTENPVVNTEVSESVAPAAAQETPPAAQ